ncbi:MAG: HU family DNA-binding protein [Bacillota bacterium]
MKDRADTVNTPHMIREAAKRMGCYKADARELLKHFTDIVYEELQKGKRIRFGSLGILYVVQDKKAVYTVRFRPSTKLLKMVNTGRVENENNGFEEPSGEKD